MQTELYVIKYADRHAAALVYLTLQEKGEILGISGIGLENCKSSSKKIKSYYKITLALRKSVSQDLPAVLRVIHSDLQSHPLFPYISFDYTANPLSKTTWSFDSYNDRSFQDKITRKRSILREEKSQND